MRITLTLILSFLLLWQASRVIAQVDHHKNLIPNPSFELEAENGHQWYFNGSDFSESISGWYAPTNASPDLYKPTAIIPDSWKKKGFGLVNTHQGQRMVGLTVYGCDDGKPHCREYISTHLKEPTIPGQNYRIDIWVKPMNGTVRTNNLGIHFSAEKVDVYTDQVIVAKPQLEDEKVLLEASHGWQRLRFFYTPDQVFRYLTLGNFRSDAETTVEKSNKWPFGYVYIDDISMVKVPPLKKTIKDEFADWYPIERGRSFVLNKVFFDFDKYSVRDQSLQELEKLYKLLDLYPDMEICIIGHTDNLGSLDYNQQLSERRANSVRSYLIERGIQAHRIVVKGKAYNAPVHSNYDELGRRQNRRVEIEIRNL